MKNKKAKNLMLNASVRVNEMHEVSWVNSISITGSDLTCGSVLVHSEYLGCIDSCAHALAQKSYIFNLPLKDYVEVL